MTQVNTSQGGEEVQVLSFPSRMPKHVHQRWLVGGVGGSKLSKTDTWWYFVSVGQSFGSQLGLCLDTMGSLSCVNTFSDT